MIFYKYINLTNLNFHKSVTDNVFIYLKKNTYILSKFFKFKYYRLILTTFRFTVISRLECYFSFGILKCFCKIFVNNIKHFLNLIIILKYSLCFNYNYLTDITCVDLLNLQKNVLNLNKNVEKNRFSLVYILTNIKTKARINVQVIINKYQIIPSLSALFLGANWLEREIYDLFGIYFVNHFDLRRILTDYGFKHHPLLKDFPLTGYLELKYNENFKTIKYVPVRLMQEFKDFLFTSPWNQFYIVESLKKN